jgi:branched-chain amino acid transport system ATP-binding protein
VTSCAGRGPEHALRRPAGRRRHRLRRQGTREITAIIGPNGAGKTTVFNCITGFYKPSTGRISAPRGQPRTGLLERPRRWHRHGAVARTFQNIRLFSGMTVLENLLVAQHNHLKTSLPAGLLRTRAYRESEQKALDNALHWLDYMGLREFVNREAGNLAYGHQRRLEIARCMVTQPRVLMLDEPAAGLNPQEKKDLQGLIEQLRNQYGLAVLLIEHDMSLVMGVSERILVMEHGRPIALGTPEAIRGDERVIKAYLGEE